MMRRFVLIFGLLGGVVLMRPGLAMPTAGQCLNTCMGLLGQEFVGCMSACQDHDAAGGNAAALGGVAVWPKPPEAAALCPPDQPNCPLVAAHVYEGGKDIASLCAANPFASGCNEHDYTPRHYPVACKNDFSRFLSGSARVVSEGALKTASPVVGQRVLWVESAGLVLHGQLAEERARDLESLSWLYEHGQFLVKSGKVFDQSQADAADVATTPLPETYDYAPHVSCFCPADCRLSDHAREYCPSGFFSPATGQCCPGHCR